MRFSVGAVDVCSGNFIYFDSSTIRIRAEHVIASGSLPPALPRPKSMDSITGTVDLISNTPLQWVLDSPASARHAGVSGRPLEFARHFIAERSDRESKCAIKRSCIRAAIARRRIGIRMSRSFARLPSHAKLISQLPEGLRDSEDAKLLAGEADDKVCNIVHLIYRSQKYEGIAKDFEFSCRDGRTLGRQPTATPAKRWRIRKCCNCRIGSKSAHVRHRRGHSRRRVGGRRQLAGSPSVMRANR